MNLAIRVNEFVSFSRTATVVILAFVAVTINRNKYNILNGGQACKPDSVRRVGVSAYAPWRSFL